MSVTTTIVFEDVTKRVVYEDDPTIGYHGERTEWKSGPEKNAADMVTVLRTGRTETRDRINRSQTAKTAVATAKTAVQSAKTAVQSAKTDVATAKATWTAGANATTTRNAFLALCDATTALANANTDLTNATIDLATQENDLAQILVEADRAYLNLLRNALSDYATAPE